jgi:hypothetical protein
MNTPELLQARGEIIALKFFLLNCMLLLTKAVPDPASYLGRVLGRVFTKADLGRVLIKPVLPAHLAECPLRSESD